MRRADVRVLLSPTRHPKVPNDERRRLIDQRLAAKLVARGDHGLVRERVDRLNDRRHAAMRGSTGAELDPRVHRVSDVYFAKAARDAFTNPALDAYLRREQVGHLVVFGVSQTTRSSSPSPVVMRKSVDRASTARTASPGRRSTRAPRRATTRR